MVDVTVGKPCRFCCLDFYHRDDKKINSAVTPCAWCKHNLSNKICHHFIHFYAKLITKLADLVTMRFKTALGSQSQTDPSARVFQRVSVVLCLYLTQDL